MSDKDELIPLSRERVLSAYRRVFGDDSEDTIISANRRADPRLHDVEALLAYDSKVWVFAARSKTETLFIVPSSKDIEGAIMDLHKVAEAALVETLRMNGKEYNKAEWTITLYPPDLELAAAEEELLKVRSQ